MFRNTAARLRSAAEFAKRYQLLKRQSGRWVPAEVREPAVPGVSPTQYYAPATPRSFTPVKVPDAWKPSWVRKYHDLETFELYARTLDHGIESSWYKGTRFEYIIMQHMRMYGMSLRRVGGKDDRGIDLIGAWTLPRARVGGLEERGHGAGPGQMASPVQVEEEPEEELEEDFEEDLEDEDEEDWDRQGEGVEEWHRRTHSQVNTQNAASVGAPESQQRPDENSPPARFDERCFSPILRAESDAEKATELYTKLAEPQVDPISDKFAVHMRDNHNEALERMVLVLLQCKVTNRSRPPGPASIRELEGAFSAAPSVWSKGSAVAFLAANREASPGVLAALRRSDKPLGYIYCDENTHRVHQMLWNEAAAEKTALGSIDVVKKHLAPQPERRESRHKRFELALVRDGRILQEVDGGEADRVMDMLQTKWTWNPNRHNDPADAKRSKGAMTTRALANSEGAFRPRRWRADRDRETGRRIDVGAAIREGARSEDESAEYRREGLSSQPRDPSGPAEYRRGLLSRQARDSNQPAEYRRGPLSSQSREARDGAEHWSERLSSAPRDPSQPAEYRRGLLSPQSRRPRDAAEHRRGAMLSRHRGARDTAERRGENPWPPSQDLIHPEDYGGRERPPAPRQLVDLASAQPGDIPYLRRALKEAADRERYLASVGSEDEPAPNRDG